MFVMKTFNQKMLRAFCAAAAVVMLLAVTSCAYPFSEVTMELVQTENGADLPALDGLMSGDEINRKLADSFAPYADTVQQTAEASDGRLSMKYELTNRYQTNLFSAVYQVTLLMSDGQDSFEIAEATVSGMKDVTFTSSYSLPQLTSPQVILSALSLQRAGVETELPAVGENADEAFAVKQFVKLYEAYTGEALDVSDIKVGEDLGEDYQKAVKLNLVPYYAYSDDYTYSDSVNVYNMSNMWEGIVTAIERDVYGRQSETVTGRELVRMLRSMYGACAGDAVEGYEQRWSDFGAVDFDAVLEEAEMTDSPLTRRDAAELTYRIAAAGPHYRTTFKDRNLWTIDDSDSIWVRRALTYGLMDYYGDSVLFAPDEGLTVVNAVENASHMVLARFDDWQNYVDYTNESTYLTTDVFNALGAVAEYFDDRAAAERNTVTVKQVINDRNYDWFFSQQNTGAYSAVNCMPSIATMASHWYDQNSTATVSRMRDTSDAVDGWTAYELRNGLDAYKVPYTIEDISLENILAALDDGKIILAQYSDRPYEQSGHCYVIYGYRQFNDSVTFIINDSDSLTDRANIFGRESGNGDELEANFSLWSIERFVSDVTVVG